MIRIQKLKQPKVSSGKKLGPGKSVKIQGVLIKNTTKGDLWADTYERKPLAKKELK